MNRQYSVVAVLTLLLLFSCNQKVDIAVEKASIIQIFDQ